MSKLFGGGSTKIVQPGRKDAILPFTAGGLRTDISGGRLTVSQTSGGGALNLPPGARVRNGRVVMDVSVPVRLGQFPITTGSLFRVIPNLAQGGSGGFGGTQTVDLGPVSAFRSGGISTRQRLVNELSGVFGTQAGRLEDLFPLVAPGFSAFRQAGLNRIEDRARRATGNLRQNLSRRRVLGSSFGQDALSRLQSEFAREESDFAARSILQELDATRQLIANVASARAQEVQTRLNELNLQAEIAASLAGGATNALSANARAQAQLAAQEASARGSFFGNLLGTVAPIAIGTFTGGAAAGGFTQASGLGLSPSDLF